MCEREDADKEEDRRRAIKNSITTKLRGFVSHLKNDKRADT